MEEEAKKIITAKDALTTCQVQGLEILNGQDNAFLTGVAGSGKSFLLRHFLKNKDQKLFQSLASTGAAAILINGVTFHRFFGLGILEGGVQKTIARAMASSRTKSRIKKVHTIIVDEVSMISGEALEAAESICRLARANTLAWGGIRVVAVGDFGQLPPVTRYGMNRDWAFNSSAWRKSDFKTIYLRTVVRSQDESFLRVLNFIRNGEVNPEVTSFLDSRLKKPADATGTGTLLFSKRQPAEAYNLEHLQKLSGEAKSFPTIYEGQAKFREVIMTSAPIPETLQLKVGALVMIRKNDVEGSYVNGSQGHVTHINEERIRIELLYGASVSVEREVFSYLDADGEVVATARNFPLNLAWATTIHKAQGMTLDEAWLNLADAFEAGQAYVALSRVRSPSGLHILNWSARGIMAAPEVRKFYGEINS